MIKLEEYLEPIESDERICVKLKECNNSTFYEGKSENYESRMNLEVSSVYYSYTINALIMVCEEAKDGKQ